jgi:hypothetical protein
VCKLPSPGLKRKSCTGKAGVVSEGCDTAYVVDEKFEVKEGSTAARESREDGLPSGLVLVAMCELDVNMLERNCTDQFLV